VIRGCEGQLWIVDRQVAAFEVEQAARAAEIVQQMAIDMKEIGIIADMRDDVLVPDLGQQRATGLFQLAYPPFGLLRPAASAANRVLHGLYSGLSPARIKAWQADARLELKLKDDRLTGRDVQFCNPCRPAVNPFLLSSDTFPVCRV
jgi:hypothetical protein